MISILKLNGMMSICKMIPVLMMTLQKMFITGITSVVLQKDRNEQCT